MLTIKVSYFLFFTYVKSGLEDLPTPYQQVF